MDFFWIFSGFFDEVYGIFGVKCPSVPSPPTKFATVANYNFQPPSVAL
jgi:hypothetical protein